MNVRECYAQMGENFEDMFSRLPREASIIKYLRRFAENTEFDELIEAVDAGNFQRVFELSHDLKGMSANLSLSKFGAQMSEICEETRGREPEKDLKVLISPAKEEHDKLIASIQQLEDC